MARCCMPLLVPQNKHKKAGKLAPGKFKIIFLDAFKKSSLSRSVGRSSLAGLHPGAGLIELLLSLHLFG